MNRRFGEAQRAFVSRVANPKKPWMKVVEHQGVEAAATLITDLTQGRIDPIDGHVVVL